MSSPKISDLSLSTKLLVCMEFAVFASTHFLALKLNSFHQFVEMPAVASNIVVIYSLLFALATQLSCLAFGLYNSKLRENYRGIMRRLFISVAMGFFVLTLCGPFFNVLERLPTEIQAMAAFLALLLTMALRFSMYKLGIFEYSRRKVLVLGAGKRSSIIERRMRRDVDRRGFSLHGFVAMNGDEVGEIEKGPVIQLQESLLPYVMKNGIEEIVVANDERRGNLPVDELFACKIRGIAVTEILDFIERETGQVAVNLIYPSWVIYSNGFASTNYLRNALDWLFNATIAFTLFLLTWPVMLITAILIKLEDGFKAPVFYFQTRVGLDGKAFNIVKFRSMTTDAEKNGAQWAAQNDARVTKLGHYLRKYRIDELPQIYNVMRGDMGFVGPRPERPQFVQDLVKTIPYYNERHNVKPGLTGWAQLQYPYGATEEDAMEKLKYDLYYIKHRSFLLDLLILIRTTEIVLFGKGR